MKYKIYLFALLFMVSTNTFSQVGIGNPNPDSTSILDLTNPNNKGLILPEAKSQVLSSNSLGMMYSFENNIFYNGLNTNKSITPWKFRFNGNISNDVYYNLDGRIGIGMSDISQRPQAPFQIETDQDVSLTDNGSIILGRSDTANLVINSNEIQSRISGASTPLRINNSGGDVIIGSKETPSNLKVSKKTKSEFKSTNTYYDLMPAGAICMWSGTPGDIPGGYALCDGSKYAKSSNSTDSITSPDLSGRFIVMAGDNGTLSYNPGDTGGHDSVTITMETMARHQHYTRDLGHSHSYTSKDPNTSGHGDDAHDEPHADGDSNHFNSTTDSGVTLVESYKGGNMPHENRPAFYALVFIIKL